MLNAASCSTVERFALSVLAQPLLEPLQEAFGDYGGLAQEAFASALSGLVKTGE